LFKISNLVQGGKEVIIRLRSSLEGTERKSRSWVEWANWFAFCQCRNWWFRELPGTGEILFDGFWTF